MGKGQGGLATLGRSPGRYQLLNRWRSKGGARDGISPTSLFLSWFIEKYELLIFGSEQNIEFQRPLRTLISSK